MIGDWIYPDWPAPQSVRAVVSTRQGGYSVFPYTGLNLGDSVGDEPEAVAANRRLLSERLRLPAEPLWLRQVHGCSVAQAAWEASGCEADAAIAEGPGKVCAILSADCLPVLLCDRAGRRVAAVHAGWRGLAKGVIESTMAAMGVPGRELLAWLGPAIGPHAFEVGENVYEAFVGRAPEAMRAFTEAGRSHWRADIYQLARQRLAELEVGFVGGGDYCTVSEPARFYSYRREGVTGRMASLIWIDDR